MRAGRPDGAPEKQLLLYGGSYLRSQDYDAMRERAHSRQIAQGGQSGPSGQGASSGRFRKEAASRSEAKAATRRA